MTISDREGLEHLLALMSDHARTKAEEKIGLSSVMAELGQEKLALAPPAEVKMPTADAPKTEERKAAAPAERFASAAVAPSAATPEEASIAGDKAIAACSQNIKLRTTLISALKEHISRAHLSQSQAAKVFGVTQPRISDLNREKVELFGLDALVNMAAAAGLRVEMHVREAKPSRASAPAT